MKTRLTLLALFLCLPFVNAEDGTSTNELPTQTYHVSKAGKDKKLLLRVFDAVKQAEEKKNPKGGRALQVRQRINSKTFLVTAGGTTDFWFIALEPKDLTDHDRFKVDAVLTDQTKSFNNGQGETITVRVLKEVETKSKPGQEFTKEEFVKRLKEGETWELIEFEEQKCPACGGDGYIGKLEDGEECRDCEFGKIMVDYLVKW